MKVAAMALLVVTEAFGATFVGNGDDGSDLEGAVRLSRGAIVEAREKAVVLLRKLNANGMPGLGYLLPEVEKSTIYLARKDVAARLKEDQGAFHSNMRGLVFARTFAKPYAATRFFPVARTLSTDQLVALHIHEGLHRSLPQSVREDEAIVARLTLAITSPDATHDRILQVVQKTLPTKDEIKTSSAATAPALERAFHEKTSTFGLALRLFQNEASGFTPVKGLQLFRLRWHPKGQGLGLGVAIGVLAGAGAGVQTFPVEFSLTKKLWKFRNFDFGVWAQLGLPTLLGNRADDPSMRNTFSVGFLAENEEGALYLTNRIGFKFGSTVGDSFSSTRYEYGSAVEVSLHSGARVGLLRIGAFADVHFSDGFRIYEEFALDNETPEGFRIISGGPELNWVTQSVQVGLRGRFVISSTRGADLDFLGDVMGVGSGSGHIEANVGWRL